MSLFVRAAALVGLSPVATEAQRLSAAAAADLREIALGMLGRAELMAGADAVTVAASARSVLTVADALCGTVSATSVARRLRPEKLALDLLVAQAVESVVASLSPGRRLWRVAPDVAGLTARADRRASRQVLAAVLTSAARATSHDDCIEIRRLPGEPGLVVIDEGAGTRAEGAGQSRTEGVETRGLGLGLVVARSLMEAHGGALTVESVARVGSRVTLRFPRG